MRLPGGIPCAATLHRTGYGVDVGKIQATDPLQGIDDTVDPDSIMAIKESPWVGVTGGTSRPKSSCGNMVSTVVGTIRGIGKPHHGPKARLTKAKVRKDIASVTLYSIGPFHSSRSAVMHR